MIRHFAREKLIKSGSILGKALAAGQPNFETFDGVKPRFSKLGEETPLPSTGPPSIKPPLAK